MKRNLKKIDVKDLVVGASYDVFKDGCHFTDLVFTHSECIKGRIYYNFTFGNLENYKKQFNIFSVKSNLRIFKEM